MEALKGIVHDACSLPLRSVLQRVTPAAWTSLSTGVPPHKHGIHDFRHYDPFTLEERLAGSGDLRVPTVWQLVAKSLGPVVTVNLPGTYPPLRLDGICVSGFDAPYGKAPVTHPAELEDELKSRFPGFYRLKHIAVDKRQPDWRDDYTRKAIDATTQEAEIGLYCLDRVDWRAAIVQFQTIDGFQHSMWSEIDRDVPSDNVRAFYGNLDKQIGRLIGAAQDRGATVMIVSDHGFQRFAGKMINVNALLESLGLLKRLPQKPERHFLPYRLRQMVKRAKRKLTGPDGHIEKFRRRTVSNLALDWAATEAYVPICHICAYVYVSRRDREPEGIVSQSAVPDIVARISQAALELKNPDTDAPVFEEALTRQEAFGGSQDLHLPELVLVPSPGYSSALNLRPGSGIFETWEDGEGVHAPDGLFAACGPHVVEDGRIDGPPPRLENIAPTILRLLGLRPPDYMSDCGPLERVFGFPPIQRDVAARPSKGGSGRAMSDDEAESVRDRLKDLGYLG